MFGKNKKRTEEELEIFLKKEIDSRIGSKESFAEMRIEEEEKFKTELQKLAKTNRYDLIEAVSQKIAEGLEKILDYPIRVALIGSTTSGKSSLINAIFDRNIAKVQKKSSKADTTKQTTIYTFPNLQENEISDKIIFVDSKGIGTEENEREIKEYYRTNFTSKDNPLMKNFDICLFMYSPSTIDRDRKALNVLMDDEFLHDNIFIIANRLDEYSNEDDKSINKEDLLKYIKTIRNKYQIPENDAIKILPVGSVKNNKINEDIRIQSLENLMNHILLSSENIKHNRFKKYTQVFIDYFIKERSKFLLSKSITEKVDSMISDTSYLFNSKSTMEKDIKNKMENIYGISEIKIDPNKKNFLEYLHKKFPDKNGFNGIIAAEFGLVAYIEYYPIIELFKIPNRKNMIKYKEESKAAASRNIQNISETKLKPSIDKLELPARVNYNKRLISNSNEELKEFKEGKLYKALYLDKKEKQYRIDKTI